MLILNLNTIEMSYPYPLLIAEGREQPDVISNTLKQVSLRLVNHTTCANDLEGLEYGLELTNTMICATKGISGQETCQVWHDFVLSLQFLKLWQIN